MAMVATGFSRKADCDLPDRITHPANAMIQKQHGGPRREAEKPPPTSNEERKLLHELQVHQIELESQNEELQQSQRDLESSRSRYFDLYHLAPVGYFTLDAAGIILEANLTAATLFGLPRGKLIRKPIERFVFRDDQDIFSH